MKGYAIIILCILFSNNLFSQEVIECYSSNKLPNISTRSSSEGPHDDFIPNENTPIKTLRVSFHFILPKKNVEDSLRNFDPIRKDGYLNRYQYVEDLVRISNNDWAWNEKMRLMPNNNTPNLPSKVRIQLSGVSFIYNDNEYRRYFKENDNVKYNFPRNLSKNPGCLDIYIYNNDFVNRSGGVASGTPGDYLTMNGCWLRYLTDLETIRHTREAYGLPAFA